MKIARGHIIVSKPDTAAARFVEAQHTDHYAHPLQLLPTCSRTTVVRTELEF